MLEFAKKYAANVFTSQNGEEGIIRECISRMKLEKGFCVEIGANDGLWYSNTALLLSPGYGWRGLMVEADYGLYLKCRESYADNPKVTVLCCVVNGHNVNAFVKDDCDLLSTDTDGEDFKIFYGLKAKPKIVIVEIDSSLPPDVYAINSDGGAGYKSMVELGLEKGYFLLCHTGNLILIDEKYRDLFPEITADPIKEWEQYFNTSWRQAA